MAGIGLTALSLGLAQRRGGTIPPPPLPSALLIESGEHLLLEDGGILILE